MTPIAPWAYLVTPTRRIPIRKRWHMPAFRAQLDALLAAGATAWIERFDGLVLYPRPKRAAHRPR